METIRIIKISYLRNIIEMTNTMKRITHIINQVKSVGSFLAAHPVVRSHVTDHVT